MKRAPRHLIAVGAALVTALGGLTTAAAQSSSQVSRFAFGGSPSPATLVQLPARLEGSVVVRFHGDPATGCAPRGLCGYTGTVLWRPPRSGSLEIVETTSHRRRSYQSSLFLVGPAFLGGGVTSADVNQTLPTPSATSQPVSCADAAPATSSIALPVRSGRIRFSLAQASPSPLQTRCAGPLIADVASALAAPSPTLRAALRGAITLDLTGAHSFASHGFAGSVDSTLAIRLGRPQRPQSSPLAPTGPTVLSREVQVTYRAAIAGRVSVAMSGDAAQGLCGPLGACGRHGTLSLVPDGRRVRAQLQALGPASRPERDFLAALGLSRAGRARGITVIGDVAWNQGGVVTVELNQGSVSCRDSAGLGASIVLLTAHRGRLSGQYVAGQGLGNPLRTRCPGPFGPQGVVATGGTRLSILSARRATLFLDAGAPLVDAGYSGTSTPHLTLTLIRQRVRTFLFRLPKGRL